MLMMIIILISCFTGCPGGALRFNKQRETRVSTKCNPIADNNNNKNSTTTLVIHDYIDPESGEEKRIELSPNDTSWKTLTCTRKIRESTKTRLQPCGPISYSNVMIDIGWTSDTNFTTQLSVCHNIADETTWFSNHTIQGSLSSFGTFEKDDSRPSYFKEGSQFFTKSSASTSYKLRTQKDKFIKIFGAQNDFFSIRRSFYLARGHLTPDGDFDLIHNSLADATYHYINVAPMWQSINNGNWKVLEGSIRLYVSLLSEDFVVYTGTYGVLKLPNKNGVKIPIYLGEDELIPVPKLIWKILFNPRREEAIVFIGSNNPFLEQIETVCPDLCEDTHWNDFLEHRRFEVSKGYLYCCSYHSVKKVISWLPDLGNPFILQNRVS
ncbi:salivary protein Tsal1 [Lepeophtheirus salmonis]|uniref:DNA/RNA non-specific endonuclease/pyrophosphatase/phosphodiesterase domain-containing protein n=1 Tax=Lepeophtheirus salmonis TaxID=72036 RepID=A0A0K2V334_LEPSM